jgi:two-component system response regulator PilR (NtrC family)
LAPRILFVEDDPDITDSVSLLLEAAGFRVTQSSCVAEADQLAHGGGFDLYLLDSQLPDGLGINLCRQIRAVDPSTPIIFCSGASEETDKLAALAAGAQAYLVKPQGLDDLERTIQGLLTPPAR